MTAKEGEPALQTTRYGKDGCGYMYNINAHINDMSRLIEGQAPYVIDAAKYGNVSRFINHSCSPNLVNHPVLIDNMDSQRAHIGLYASRDIAMGDELSFDYHNTWRRPSMPLWISRVPRSYILISNGVHQHGERRLFSKVSFVSSIRICSHNQETADTHLAG